MLNTGLTTPESFVHGTRAIDLADLVSTLVSATSPNRTLDVVIDAMLGGSEPRNSATPDTLRAARWLAEEAPAYTAGGPALIVLARRRGYRLHVDAEGSGHRARAYNPLTGAVKEVSAPTEGGAGVAAIAWLASTEVAK